MKIIYNKVVQSYSYQTKVNYFPLAICQCFTFASY